MRPKSLGFQAHTMMRLSYGLFLMRSTAFCS